MPEQIFQAVVKRWSDGSGGVPAGFPTHSRYALRFTEPFTHERAGDIATRLVAIERLMSSQSQRFGRVVFLGVAEEGGYTFGTPTGTCLPSSERMVANPEQLTGLRREHMAHDACSVTLYRDRETGGRWRQHYMAALSLSECVPSLSMDKRRPAWALDLDGPTAAWCARRAAWGLGEIPEFTPDVEVSDEGVLSRHEPSYGDIGTAYATDNAKLRAWASRAPAAVRALWQVERENDFNVTRLLRIYRDTLLSFDHTWWDGHEPGMIGLMGLIEHVALTWAPYAWLLGYTVPGQPPARYEATRHYGVGNVAKGSLTLKRNRRQVFDLVSWLHRAWLWCRWNRQPVYYYGQPNGEGLFPPAGASFDMKDGLGLWYDPNGLYGTFYGRASTMFFYRHYPEMVQVMWGVVHALNILEALIVPANRRALERVSPARPTVEPVPVGRIPRRVPSVWEFEPFVSIGTAPRDPVISLAPQIRPPNTAVAIAPARPRRQFKWDFSTDAERRGTTDYDADEPEPHEYGGEPGQGPREALWRQVDAVGDAWLPEARRREWDANSRAAQELARFGDGYDTPHIQQG